MPQEQQQQQKKSGQGARRSTSRPFAEIRVRDKNMKMQLQLASACAKFDRDWSTWNRDNEKSERNLLVDLAHMMDSKLTPSVDDWFDKRRIRQASCLPDLPRRRALRGTGAGKSGDVGSDDDDDDDDSDPDSAMRLLDRQRILEVKRADWLGVTSVPTSRRRPLTAAAVASASSGGGGGAAGAASETAGGAAASAGAAAAPPLAAAARPKTAGRLLPRTG